MTTNPKKVFVILFCAFFLALTAMAANDAPPVVISGLDTYRTNDLKAAYEIWSKGTLENDK